MSPLKHGVFYGWWIALGGMAVLILSSGIAFYGHALILDPLVTEFGWSKGTVSSAVTLLFFVSALTGSILGGFLDRYGPSLVLVLGALCTGAGFALLGSIHHLWQLYGLYVVLAVGHSCSGVVPISTMIANWFIRKRGLAMSVAMSGLSLGGAVVVPAASFLLQQMGLRAALPWLGFAFAAVVIPIALLVVKSRPAGMGLFPDGEPSPSPVSKGPQVNRAISSQMISWTRMEAMATKTFWLVAFSFFLVLCGQITFMIHEISFLNPLLGTAGAAMAVSLTSVASFCGRFLVGSFVDRADKRRVTAVCFLLQGAAVFTAAHATQPLILYLCVILFGLTMGNIVMMQPLIVGEFFGMVSFGRVSGLMMLFTSSGSALGPMIGGLLFDLTLGYRVSFTTFACGYALASLVILAARAPVRFRFGVDKSKPDLYG
ncbi:MAG: MFS transporter [Thermodesulfobacteriota bacterium]